MQKSLDQLIDKTERIGVIGSPSSTSEMALDILASAVNKKLVGELALFRYHQDGLSHYALGQITEVKLRNVWHEDPTMRSLIRQRGRVDAVSERQDTHLGEMTISAVFSSGSNGYRPSILGTVPATGTPIHLVNDDVLSELLSPYRDQLFYLGHVYGSKPLLPLWFKHFDTGPRGAGEAYHLGIFGKTGSGKSVLAKMILLAYARYPEMAILVIDPQGEFAKEIRGEAVLGGFQLPMRDVLNRLKKPVQVLGVRNLVLDRWNLFEHILLESGFFQRLGVKAVDNQRQATEVISEQLQKDSVRLADLHRRENFDKVWKYLQEERILVRFYASKDARERVHQQMADTNQNDLYQTVWLPVTQLFREDRPGAKRVERLLASLFDLAQAQRPLIVIDLSVEQMSQTSHSSIESLPLFGGDRSQSQGNALFWNDMIQALVIKRLLEGVRTAAEYAYIKNRSLNTLVLMDEAHRLAPREDPENEEKRAVRGMLIDAARTTRKYGVGWMFISQTLSSLHREILEQLRIFFFGFGLGMGAEFKALSELVGGRSKALDLYQLFRDPHSSFDIASREYSFMTIGPVSPLSFAGTPLFFNAFNTVEEFLDTNKLGQ
ncbi:ATPase [Thermanaerothrix daxensis]|uniref:ATPase n=1 Tax=Thermanaerothrix daxensis TaxID=869279 RepID=A0A0P6Y1V1_9CHLR|nr:ATP-binding protein [Thermanaerothrix daxensis]KPL83072.1 ATPase [Thermanaerothrix daxensis]